MSNEHNYRTQCGKSTHEIARSHPSAYPFASRFSQVARRLVDTQTLAALGGDHLRRPWRIPHEVDIRFRHAGQGHDLVTRVGRDRGAHAAALSRQRHLHFDFLGAVVGVLYFHSIDEAEVDDIDGDFGIEAGLELLPYHRFKIAAARRRHDAGIRRRFAERVGVLARDAKQPAVRGNLQGEGSAERLRDKSLEAFFEHHLVPRGNLHAFALADQFNTFHWQIPSLSDRLLYRDVAPRAIA